MQEKWVSKSLEEKRSADDLEPDEESKYVDLFFRHTVAARAYIQTFYFEDPNKRLDEL